MGSVVGEPGGCASWKLFVLPLFPSGVGVGVGFGGGAARAWKRTWAEPLSRKMGCAAVTGEMTIFHQQPPNFQFADHSPSTRLKEHGGTNLAILRLTSSLLRGTLVREA